MPAHVTGASTRAVRPPGLSLTTAGWLHRTEIAAIATDTWGFEMRDLDALAEDCAADGVHAFWLTAAPLPITGAVGSPVNPVAVK